MSSSFGIKDAAKRGLPAAVIAAGFALASGPAIAARVDLGNIGGRTIQFGNEFQADETGSFEDIYTFSIPDGAAFIGRAKTLDGFLNQAGFDLSMNIDDFSYTLEANGRVDGPNVCTDEDCQFAGAGFNDFTLTLSGNVVGNLGGAYGASLAAVPVPPALLLLGSALAGLIGFARKR